jgi:hypothetical protein
MKPMLKAPRIQLLKLKCDKLLSTVAFKFDLRRYNTVAAKTEEELDRELYDDLVRRCMLTLSSPR